MQGLRKLKNSTDMYFRLFGAAGVYRRLLVEAGRSTDFLASIPEDPRRRVHIRLGTSDVASFEQVFINKEYEFDIAKSPTVIIDAGANIGMSAIYFTLRYPMARIFAVEPEPSNFEVLTKNSRFFPNIMPIQAALWNHNRGVSIDDRHLDHWGIRVSNKPSGGMVQSITMTELLAVKCIDHVDLLKIDVEGAECEILENASSWINRVDVICAELHDNFRNGCSKAFEVATTDFPIRWSQGELRCVARKSHAE
jgi:FkbM family methyltransferase